MRSFFASRLTIFFIAIVLALGLLVAFLPSIASTSWGKKQIVTWINRSIPGKIEINRLHLQWGHGQTIEGFLLNDAQGNFVLEFERLMTQASLWQIIQRSTHLGQTELQDLHASLIIDNKGISNLQYALGLNDNSPFIDIPPSTILLSDTYASMDLFSGQNPLSFNLRGETKQEQLEGSFNIEAILPSFHFENWEKLSQDAQQLFTVEGSKNVFLKAQVKSFPVDLLDQALALQRSDLKGIFRSLFGHKLSLFLDKESSATGLAFHASLIAPLLQADLKGKINGSQFSLQEPARLHFNLIPVAFNSLIKNYVTLQEATHVKVKINELSFPLNFFDKQAKIDPCSLAIAADAQLQDNTLMQFAPLGEIKLLNVNLNFASPLCAKEIQLKLTGKGQVEKQAPFDLQFSSQLHKPISIDDLLLQLQNGSESTLSLNRFPLNLSPLFAENQIFITQSLGSFVDINVYAKQINPNQFDLLVNLKTPRLAINQAHFAINSKELNLAAPLRIQYVIDPKTLEYVLQEHQVAVYDPIPLNLTLTKFTKSVDNKIFLEAEAAAPAVSLVHPSTAYLAQLKNVQAKIAGAAWPDMNLQFTSEVDLLNPDGTALPFLGKNGRMTFFSQPQTLANHPDIFTHLKATVESSLFNLALEGNLLQNNEFVLTHPLQASYILKPEILNDLQLEDSYPLIQNNPTFFFKVDSFQHNLNHLKLDTLLAKGSLLVDQVVLQSKFGGRATLKQIDIPWEINSPLNLLRLNLKGEAFTDARQNPSKLSGQLLISNWLKDGKYNLSNLKVEAVSNLIGLPTSLLSSLVIKEDLTPLVGSIVDLELNSLIDNHPDTPGHWDMNLDSPLIHLKARLKVGEAITLYETSSRAVEVRWTLTPQGYLYLNQLMGKHPDLQPTSDIIFKGFLSDLFIPRQNASLGGNFNASFETNEVAWNDATIPAVKLKGQVQSPNLNKQINLTLHTLSKESTSLAINGQIANFLDAEGKIDPLIADIQLDIKSKSLPLTTARLLLGLDHSYQNQIQTSLGSNLDAQITAKLNRMSGPIDAHIQGSQGKISLVGQLNKGILTLLKPFEWQIQFTPALSQAFLNQNIPLFGSAIGAENPIKIFIDPKDFALPLIPFNLDKINISQGMIDLGKVRFRNEGDINHILSLLKPVTEEVFTVWFTPLYFQLAKAKLLLKRVDLLVAQQYSLAAWGEIDLNTHRMDLILGLSSQALQAAFGLQGLDPKSMLQIPIKSRNGKTEIDRKKALARIGALAAQMHGNNNMRLFGSVIDLATSHKDAPIPPPTTQPLPWEKDFPDIGQKTPESSDSPSTNTPIEKKEKKKRGIKKELEKGASSILDFLNR
jgi:hypothetical protein